ncbi:MAG: trehalose-phosphatase [Pseudomonadota bacterium]
MSSVDLSPPPTLDTLFQAGRVALFLDFDGTLVELAPGPDAITPLPDLGMRLEMLAERVGGALALVSGRAVDDIARHIGPLKVAAAGSHGSDIRLRDGTSLGKAPTGLPPEIERELREFAASNGLDYEHKPHGGALHYRSAPEREEEAKEFAAVLADEHGWAVQHGKCVVELVAGHATKGTAVDTFMGERRFAGAQPIFVGDDLTDEAGFAACAQLGGIGIVVGDRAPTRASYRLEDVASVHRWLGL